MFQYRFFVLQRMFWTKVQVSVCVYWFSINSVSLNNGTVTGWFHVKERLNSIISYFRILRAIRRTINEQSLIGLFSYIIFHKSIKVFTSSV